MHQHRFSRRFALKLALQTGALVAVSQVGFVRPARAQAQARESKQAVQYQAYVSYAIARRGGTQKLYAYDGTPFTIRIPRKTSEGSTIAFTDRTTGEVRSVFVHTLYDRQTKIGLQIYDELDKNVGFLLESSRDRCKSVYEDLEDGRSVDNLEALGLLDYIISTSSLPDEIQQPYQIASENSKVLRILEVLESALDASALEPEEKRTILGTFARVVAGEIVADVAALQRLDTLIAGSDLPLELKNRYSVASTKSLAFTADLAILNLLDDIPDAEVLVPVYQKVRDGAELEEEETPIATQIDRAIASSSLPSVFVSMYALARGEAFQERNRSEEIAFAESMRDLANSPPSESVRDISKSVRQASNLVPQTTKALTMFGAEASTGAAIGSLSGGAATNATLAFLGGGSVAAGGLGMLGGLAVATGGAALLGAAGVLSYAFVSELDRQDYQNLGISVGSGALAGAAATLALWTAAGAGTTATGAAAIGSTLAALGGVSVLTGGTAFIASGTAFLVWSLLKKNKKRDDNTLQAIEVRLHSLVEPPQPGSFAHAVLSMLPESYGLAEIYKGLNLDLKKVKTSLKKWLQLEEGETIIASIDTSIFNDLKEGICLTDRRIIWKSSFQDSKVLDYMTLKQALESSVVSMLDSSREYSALQDILDLANTLLYEQSQLDFMDFLTKLVSLPSLPRTERQMQ